jgi:hypothetical protein
MPLGQGLVDRRHDLQVAEQLIGVLHPRFVKVLGLLSDQPVAEAALRTIRPNPAKPEPNRIRSTG